MVARRHQLAVLPPGFATRRTRRRTRRSALRGASRGCSSSWTTSAGPATGGSHLFVVPADGSAEAKQITDGDYEDSPPTWTPDGKSIAFSSARGEDWDIELVGDIYVVPAAGGEPKRLTPGDSNHYAAAIRRTGSCSRSSGTRADSTFRATRRSPSSTPDRRGPADPDRVARPDVRPLPGSAGADLGRRLDRLRDRGRGNIHLYRVPPRAASPSSSPVARSSSAATTRATAGSSAPARPRRT